MSPGISLIVGFLLIPVVSHLDRGAFVLPLVADKSIGKSTIGILGLAQNFHSQDPGIKIQRFFLIEHSDHGVIQAKIRLQVFFHSY